MRKLTAGGRPWEQVNDPFENLVDQANEIVKGFGVSRMQIEQDMQGIKKQMEIPGCDTDRLGNVFLAGLRDVFNEPFPGQDTTGKSMNGTPDA